MTPKIKMVVEHPRFAYAEIAESAQRGWWQLRWEDSMFRDPPQFRMLAAATFDDAQREADRFFGEPVFAGFTVLVAGCVNYHHHRSGQNDPPRQNSRRQDGRNARQLPRSDSR